MGTGMLSIVESPFASAQLRIAGAGSVDGVGAMILETTGDVSVLTSEQIDDELIADVRGRSAA